MSLFGCDHDWKEIAKTHAPPTTVRFKRVHDEEAALKLILGVTTILWECQDCHEIRREEMLGKETKNGK